MAGNVDKVVADKVIKRGTNGRFVKGNASGKLTKGKRKNPKILKEMELGAKAAARKAAVEVRVEALKAAKKTISASVPQVVTKLRDQAMEGDTRAAGILLRHALPVAPPETRVTGAEHLAGMEPEQRLVEIGRLLVAGELPHEHADVLTKQAHAEIDARILKPLKQLLHVIRSGGNLTSAVRKLQSIPLDVRQDVPEPLEVLASPSGGASDD